MKWMMKTILIIGFPRLQSIIAYKCMIKGVKALLLAIVMQNAPIWISN